MDALDFSKNKYFFDIIYEKNAKNFDIRDEKFQKQLLKYIDDYTRSHWSIIEDYLLNPSLDKIDIFNKSFKDFQFFQKYVMSAYSGFMREELKFAMNKLSREMVNVEYNFVVKPDSYHLLCNNQEIPRKDPITVLVEDFNINKSEVYILFFTMYGKEFISQLKNSYIHKNYKDNSVS